MMLKLMLNTYYKELIRSHNRTHCDFTLSIRCLLFQILYTTKIANEYSENTKHIAEEVMDYGM
ncbi:hypothetical protein OK016_19915 [Vibrio chagasii]|nr:hypothetical protein [Vibrio chagasii]